MKISIPGILEGIKNTVFVKEEVEKIAAARKLICRGCDYDSVVRQQKFKETSIRPDEHCTHCQCNIHLKTRALSEACPIGKWMALATDQEDDQIQEALK